MTKAIVPESHRGEYPQNPANIIEDLLSDNIFGDEQHAAKLTLSLCDLTTLSSTDNEARIADWCKKSVLLAEDHNIRIAALCCYPVFAETAAGILSGSGIRLACVAGGFPDAQTTLKVKVAEIGEAVKNGADEIDLVMPTGLLRSGETYRVADELAAMSKACGDATMKVILEVCNLNDDQIRIASDLALYNGAGFIKTSTGKGIGGASPDAVNIMCQAINTYNKEHGNMAGLKPSGGIATLNEALKYMALAYSFFGKDYIRPEQFRLGTSRLVNNLLHKLLPELGKYY